jgi:hypothetical protein
MLLRTAWSPRGARLFCAHKMATMKFLLITLAVTFLMRRLIPAQEE